MRPISIAQYLSQLERENSAADTEAAVLEFEAPAFVAPPPQAPQDLDALLDEAYERGRRDGETAAQAEWAERETSLTEACEAKAREERIAFQAEEIAKFADSLTENLANLELRIAEVVARILEPFLVKEQTRHILDALCRELKGLLDGDAPPLLRITGPEDLLSQMHRRLQGQPVEVEYWADDVVELSVEVDDTRIMTQLKPWSDLILDKKD